MRHDDSKDGTYFRSSERIFRMNEHWYFAAREGDQGPYSSEQSARKQAAQFIAERTQLAKFQSKRVSKKEGKHAVLAGVASNSLALEEHNQQSGGVVTSMSAERLPARASGYARQTREQVAPAQELMI